jgi:putative redox protein
MKSVVDVKWLENMKFEADVNGHKLTMDTDEENGGSNKGPRPKPLMMVALAGCTGMDVVSILKKMKVELSYFNVRVEGEALEDHPMKYIKMKVIYEFKGKNLEHDKLQKAVNLSVDKYCSVNAIYKEVIDMEYEIRVL